MRTTTDDRQRLLSETSEWPKSWQFDRDDLPAGKAILREVTPFLQHLVDSGLSAKTLRNHFSNIWLLGGELIERINEDSDLRKLSALDLIFEFVDKDGGPYSRHLDTERAEQSYDSSCRRLYQFIVKQSDEKR
jgi:hypothetical protein